MNFPLVNVFEKPYEAWEFNKLKFDEIYPATKEAGFLTLTKKTKRIAEIRHHVDAATYILRRSTDNGLESHIDRYLDRCAPFQQAIRLKPRQFPTSIKKYKHSYQTCNLDNVAKDINAIGCYLHPGQIVFHGGLSPQQPGEAVITDRPLSTSFCPQVALRNAEWRGKAYEAGEVHLLVLRVASTSIRAFVFPLEGELGNEKEVLISSNVNLVVLRKTLVRNDYKVCKIDSCLKTLEKAVPAYVVEVEIVN